MHTLIDKIFIFLCSAAWMLFLHPSVDFSSIAAILAAFSCSCFLSYLNPDGFPQHDFREHPLFFLLCGVYVGICFLLPDACFLLPVIFYDMLYTRFYLLYFLGFIAFLLSFQNTSLMQQFLLGLQFALALLLHLRSMRISVLTRQVKEIRDTDTEYQLMLSAKNRDLLEKQDYEIYLATLKERNRIAREIHDNVGHMLSRSILQAGALLAVNQDKNLKEPLTALKDTLNLAMNNIRESVHDLHDDSIDMKSAVEQMLPDYDQYQIQFDYDMSRMVEKNVKYCFISITKEALSNLVKHSNATRLSIVMREHPSLYQLLISDNGTKILLRDSGIGLSNMKERVNGLGGTITISTESGFRIFVSIPKG